MDEELASELGSALAKLNKLIEGIAAKDPIAPTYPPATPVNLQLPTAMPIDVTPLVEPMAAHGEALASGIAKALAGMKAADLSPIAKALDGVSSAMPKPNDYSAAIKDLASAMRSIADAQRAHTKAVTSPVSVTTDALGNIVRIG